MPRRPATEAGRVRRLTALVCVAAACASLPAAAADGAGLQAKIEAARSQASALVADLQAKQAQLAAAQQRAAAASARERRLSGLLATGEERAAILAGKVSHARRRLVAKRERLRRARRSLSRRLVAIYESGSPSEASVVLASADFGQLATRVGYLQAIESSDSALAARVAQVRDAVRRELALVAELKAGVDAYDARLAAARSQISTVRQGAESAAAQLQSIAAARQASLATLRSNIGVWVGEIQAARAAASRSSAEATVERWLGGPYSIPSYIVMCESGGNYGAVNPSSGAGGAYQILPSTWKLYGGHGSPQGASKPEQDSIAAQIWADSGPSAWACGG